MASRHDYGCKLATSLFSTEGRGRLFSYRQGLFRAPYSDQLVKVGVEGVPDLIGITFSKSERSPIPTWVEVKTCAAPRFRKAQRFFMDYMASVGCLCICYRENKNGEWNEYKHGDQGFY